MNNNTSSALLSLLAVIIFLIFFSLIAYKFETKNKTSMLISIIFAASFISIFFFTQGHNIEKQILEKELSNVVDDILDGAKILIPDNTRKLMKQKLDEEKLPDLSEQDNQVINNNKKLFHQTLIFISFLVFFSLIYVIILWKKNKVNLNDIGGIFIRNIIIIMFIGITEFLFLRQVSYNYRSADPNKIKLTLIREMKNIKSL